MSVLLTAAQMRTIERAAIDSGKVTGLELMERAGQGVVEAIFEEWPELRKTSHRAVIFCGPGNNGGDGFVVARLLKEWGWEVDVFLFGDAANLPPDAKTNHERWVELGPCEDIQRLDAERYMDLRPDTVLAVDALFGTGLARPFLDLGRFQDELNYWRSDRDMPKVVAVDIPSGICSDSGRYLGYGIMENPLDMAILANLTVTFEAPRQGHHLAASPIGCGKVVVKSIDLELPTDLAVTRFAASPTEAGLAPLYARTGKHIGHKYVHGHALILSGGTGRTGAARLAARGALRIGAGLVTLGCPKSALPEIAAQVTAIMVRTLDGAPELSEALEDERLNALCLGPGLGLGADAATLVRAALSGAEARPTDEKEDTGRGSPSHPGRAIVLDADALTLLSRNESLFEALHARCVLTPHAGEFRRLFPDITDKLDATATTGPAYSKVDATREAAARAGCVVLFKGSDTVIADPSGRCAINSSAYERAAPWLATAGAGDVLAGFITGLLARGFRPMEAAETAAWLHTECALSFGPGVIAEDLPEELPKVLRSL